MNKEKLYELVRQRKSLKEISAITQVSPTTIRYWIDKHSIKRCCKCCGNELEGTRSTFCSTDCKLKSKKPQGTPSEVLQGFNKPINWKNVQIFYDNGKTWRETALEFGIYSAALAAARKIGLFVTRTATESRKLRETDSHPQSDETKAVISEKRKKWLLENPDKHVWKRGAKFKSVPCENVKKYLTDNGIKFESEVSPIPNRAFSIDIAFPERKVAIEINGNQHYNKDGTLRQYYAERHALIESAGWKLHEVHYTNCFDPEKIKAVIDIALL